MIVTFLCVQSCVNRNAAALVDWFVRFDLLCIICFAVFLFSPLGRDSSAVDASTIWRRRCQLICCTCKTEDTSTSDAYSDIANLVSSYFQVELFSIISFWLYALCSGNYQILSQYHTLLLLYTLCGSRSDLSLAVCS